MSISAPLVLENGLDLREVVTTGSILHINEDYNENDTYNEPIKIKHVDFIGAPVKNFADFAKNMQVHNEMIKKRIIEVGGGVPLHEGCTVFIAFSGYWENEMDAFDECQAEKPMEVDLKSNGLLPGLDMAVKSMLVGELSVFLISYKLMYGEMGVPPRIKPKADCVFYIKLLRSILTPNEGKLNLSEPNMFTRVEHEAKMLYTSGVTLFKSNNYSAAIQLFRKAIFMLHGCRLADENEEKKQVYLLKKLYLNLMICYNNVKVPLKACTACNELKRLEHIWNNGKILYHNAKSLRMIGEFDIAEKRLKRAQTLCPDNKEISSEMDLLLKLKNSCNQTKLSVSDDDFKEEVDKLIKNFKENADMCTLSLTSGLDIDKMKYLKEVCIRENLFLNTVPQNYDKDADTNKSSQNKTEEKVNYAVNKEDIKSIDITNI